MSRKGDEPDIDHLHEMLELGWQIEGYSTTMMAAGALTHSILLRRGSDVAAVNVAVKGAEEVGRYTNLLSPKVPKKKGWF
jgi:Na+-driven multidrug efflux pump